MRGGVPRDVGLVVLLIEFSGVLCMLLGLLHLLLGLLLQEVDGVRLLGLLHVGGSLVLRVGWVLVALAIEVGGSHGQNM